MNDPLTVARWLVHDRHFIVIPLDHPDATRETDPQKIGKVPRIAWRAFQHTRPTDDNLVAWFSNGPQNLGLVTGAISQVVSIDGDSADALEWMRTHLPPTEMRTKTAKGEHWYYRHPGGLPVRNQLKLRTEGTTLDLDVKADGGYCVAPTSKHASGVLYERLGTWPPVADLPPFNPSWLAIDVAPAFSHPAHGQHLPPSCDAGDRAQLLRRARAYVESVPPAIEGQGGDLHTFQLACKLVRGFALDDSEALELLREWNQTCVPPWTERELEEKIRSARKSGREPFGGRAATNRREPPRRETPAEAEASDRDFQIFNRTDLGNAEAFVAWFGHEWRFDFQQGVWRHWDDPIWAIDVDGLIVRDATATMRRRYQQAVAIPVGDRELEAKWAIQSEARGRIEACLYLAARLKPIADAGDRWDADPYRLACPNGVVDLRTGSLHEGRQREGLTMRTAAPFDPDARCPRFEQFMLEITNGDRDLVAYLQKALGLSLTGDTSDQAWHLVAGPGSGGKTTLLRTIGATLGSYAYTAPFSTFLKDQHGTTVPNDLAALRGRRFVAASEVRERAKLDEGRIKSLTGGDEMTARFLHQEYFTFRPTLHLWLAVNHRPVVTDDSLGFWRRVRLVPLTQRFPISRTLDQELQAEAPGILAWLVRGCLLWQAEDLQLPAAVSSATSEYEEDSDPIADFLEAMCVVDLGADIGAADFYKLYGRWAENAGLTKRERLSATSFGRLASGRFSKRRTTNGVRYFGVGMRM